MLVLVVIVEIIMLVIVSYFVFTCGLCKKIKKEIKPFPVPTIQISPPVVMQKPEIKKHITQESEQKKCEILVGKQPSEMKDVNQNEKLAKESTGEPSFVEVAQLNLKCAIVKAADMVRPTPAKQNPPVDNMEVTALQDVDINVAELSQTAIQAESLISGISRKSEMEFASVGKNKEVNVQNELIIYDKPKKIKKPDNEKASK
ncbi:hypothetical protein T4B_15112 [Trichinella pseudospiralis]|uniref:Uncharacterized protein n=1 Tax=Trichinella pseudospiralis TaxID=6337 RepID=A0A0V1I239_TRIPS|nr:hypothetical protein T4A_9700 [Trichinella pseudospiralis]KRZ16985.1 hypothetical protein T4B_15112 [Trichinella pseudospiralis]KRZ44787.1 hypothetical protein T4C_12837 [Trichinella pseudospiralis]